MSYQVKVFFEDKTTQKYVISQNCGFPIHELKRKIFEKTGIPPILQRLCLQGSTDNFALPSQVICQKRAKRNDRHTVVIRGCNTDEFKINVDLNDEILDLKFLLSTILQDKSEYIQFTINDKQPSDQFCFNSNK